MGLPQIIQPGSAANVTTKENTTTHDPAVYVVSACGFVLSSAIVTLVAARRAASVDPLVALRQ
jgi:ABC-type lipoprotein release transport system permease subunit